MRWWRGLSAFAGKTLFTDGQSLGGRIVGRGKHGGDVTWHGSLFGVIVFVDDKFGEAVMLGINMLDQEEGHAGIRGTSYSTIR